MRLHTNILLATLAWAAAFVIADVTSKPYELLFIWESFKLDEAIVGSSNRWILKDWKTGPYTFDGFMKQVCKKTDYAAGTVTNTDDLGGSIQQWRAKNPSCAYQSFDKIVQTLPWNTARTGELLSAVTSRVQSLRLMDASGKNEANDDNQNDNSSVGRLRKVMAALHMLKQRDSYVKLIPAIKNGMGDRIVTKTTKATEFDYTVVDSKGTIDKVDLSKDWNALSKLTADLGALVQGASKGSDVYWSALRRVEKLRYDLEGFRTHGDC